MISHDLQNSKYILGALPDVPVEDQLGRVKSLCRRAAGTGKVAAVTVRDCLGVGRANAVTRAELCGRTGMPDRANRKEIERLRRAGIPVISSSDGRGYWLAESAEELERFLHEADARAESQRYPRLRKAVADAKGLRVVPVRAHTRRIGPCELEGQVKL